ncbi:MAG: 16S rRNA (cytidine(1402)-2'-O)-methyltransferase [Betaproteobacteria bacterium]
MHNEPRAQLEPALYVVATPLGNLRDITLRALDVLQSVDAVAAEDTRLTRQLLSHYEIRARLIAIHQHNEAASAEGIVQLLSEGRSVACVTDAGTPAISDPGALLVRRVSDAGHRVIPVPGPSALIAALSAAGISAPHFLFYGFLPSKSSARRDALARLAPLNFALVFYEAPHRVTQTLQDMAETFGQDRELVIARELTKVFESFHRCRLGDAVGWIAQDPNRTRGEFVLIVQGAQEDVDTQNAQAERVLEILLRSLPVSQAVAIAAEISGRKKNALYERALAFKKAMDSGDPG